MSFFFFSSRTTFFRQKFKHPQRRDERKRRSKHFKAHHRSWPSRCTVRGHLCLEIRCLFFSSTGIVTCGHPWGSNHAQLGSKSWQKVQKPAKHRKEL